MQFPEGRDECVGSALYGLLCYVGRCASRIVPSVLGLLTPSLLRLLLRWDGGDQKRGGTIGDWDNMRGNATLLLVLLLPVVSPMLDGLDVSRQEAGAGAHRSRLVN